MCTPNLQLCNTSVQRRKTCKLSFKHAHGSSIRNKQNTHQIAECNDAKYDMQTAPRPHAIAILLQLPQCNAALMVSLLICSLNHLFIKGITPLQLVWSHPHEGSFSIKMWHGTRHKWNAILGHKHRNNFRTVVALRRTSCRWQHLRQ